MKSVLSRGIPGFAGVAPSLEPVRQGARFPHVLFELTRGVRKSLSPAVTSTGARMALSQLLYSAASLKRLRACRWNALHLREVKNLFSRAQINDWKGWNTLHLASI